MFNCHVVTKIVVLTDKTTSWKGDSDYKMGRDDLHDGLTGRRTD